MHQGNKHSREIHTLLVTYNPKQVNNKTLYLTTTHKTHHPLTYKNIKVEQFHLLPHHYSEVSVYKFINKANSIYKFIIYKHSTHTNILNKFLVSYLFFNNTR
ncbi:hypothetical protein Ecaj_0802 [Ehrlichia canis str. Jake]|uniref:Uncharacterized protein n=1 Tax=Ehrlichia canis (strain Jake) TaxID=269484 RepID=A0ACA6AWA7_EHRCJ|nr:hypothetical protein Ecaj_0802 [Ehrlichia canis str. Jake]